MDNLSLITCITHMNKIISRLDDYVVKECSQIDPLVNGVGNITLDDIKGLKEGNTQLIWVKEVFDKLFKNITNVQLKYEKKLVPIMANLQYNVTDELINMNKKFIGNNSFKLPEFEIFYDHSDESSNIPTFGSWKDDQEYYNNLDEIASVRELGYPGGINNISPLKEMLLNSYRQCVGTPEITDKDESQNLESKFSEGIHNSSSSVTNHVVAEYMYNCEGLKMILPVIDSLKNIPCNMYYYYGDKKNKRGVYTRISDRLVIKVPMMDTVPENTDNSREMIVKCNKGSECKYWNCTYTHPGVPYKKIGHKLRCPSCPGFSNISSLKMDIKDVDYESIRLCIMYAITDLYCVHAWCQDQDNIQDQEEIKPNEKNCIIIHDLEICGEYKNPFIDEEVWDII